MLVFDELKGNLGIIDIELWCLNSEPVDPAVEPVDPGTGHHAGSLKIPGFKTLVFSFPLSTAINSKPNEKLIKQMEIDWKGFGMDPAIMAALTSMFDVGDDIDSDKPHPPSRAYVRDAKAMRNTPADIIEYPNAYHFIVDIPGLKPDQIKVEVEEGNVLVVSGERRREKEEGVKYVRMERRVGKMLKKFVLPENANVDAVTAVNQDGVLKVVVEKLPPPEPKKPKTIEVKVGWPSEEGASGGKG